MVAACNLNIDGKDCCLSDEVPTTTTTTATTTKTTTTTTTMTTAPTTTPTTTPKTTPTTTPSTKPTTKPATKPTTKPATKPTTKPTTKLTTTAESPVNPDDRKRRYVDVPGRLFPERSRKVSDLKTVQKIESSETTVDHGYQQWTKEAQLRALNKILTYKIYGEKDMDASSLGPDSFEIYQNSLGQMVRTYSTTKVVKEGGGEYMSLEPEIYEAMTESAQNPSAESYQTQKYYFSNWNQKVGRACKDSYADFVKVSNEAAVLNNYKDTGDSWRDWYEDPEFEKLVDGIWDGLKPLYESLHAHARHVLSKAYGSELVADGDAPMPAHVLGNKNAFFNSTIF